MKALAKLAVVVGAPAMLVAAGQVSSASGPPTSPPDDSSAESPADPSPETMPLIDSPSADSSIPTAPTSAVLPAGYHWLLDDTGAITVAVPDAWSDTDTAPTLAPSVTNAPVPYIAASPDLAGFIDGWEQPGVRFVAIPYTEDAQSIVDQYGLNESVCTGGVSTEPYTDVVFSGDLFTGSDCGETGATWRIVVAAPEALDATVIVDVQTLTPEDEEAYEVILQTFNFATGGVPGSTVPGSVPMPMPTPSTPADNAPASTIDI